MSVKTDETRPQGRDYASNSQIKNIYLRIPGGYKFRHQAFESNENDGSYLGRSQISKSFIDILKSESKKGVYLVTGYRGMGKTSFVKQVIHEIKNPRTLKEKEATVSFFQRMRILGRRPLTWVKNIGKQQPALKEFFISLAQSQLKDIDILKHIVNQILLDLEAGSAYHRVRWFSLANVFSWLWPSITVLLISVNFYFIHAQQEQSKTIIENLVGIATLAAILSMFIHKIAAWLNDKYGQFLLVTQVVALILCAVVITGMYHYSENFFVSGLFDNMHWLSNPGYRNQIPGFVPVVALKAFIAFCIMMLLIIIVFKALSMAGFANTGFPPVARIHERLKTLHDRCNAQVTKEDQLHESFALSVSSLFNKNQKIFPIANPREIENELIQIIQMLGHYKQYIFVFDELDKIDPAFENNAAAFADASTEKITYLNDLRERRHLITNILASLKYFINESQAKFIFIAGREMFEASLADISDRQSSISSIFHKVIYVDSFLKDRSENESHVSAIGGLVETFLTNTLMADKLTGSADFFTGYYHLLTSTGAKTPTLDDSQARKVIFTLQNFLGYLVYRSNGSPKKITKLFEEYIIQDDDLGPGTRKGKKSIVFNYADQDQPQQPGHYLSFSYLDQYKLGYTAYLFQPFLTMNSSFMKRYSDNTLVSIPYLIDNLIKFHPFAFSPQNLELLPEILATNRNPISRPFLEDLISFLAQNHIRKTESGLYEYKFYDRTHNEITFISKLFEDEAAAFNFTLDETFSIKTHLQAKIRHLRSAHTGPNASNNPIISIVFLNRLLGDARFQDEEYQDAIVSYQDALQMIALNEHKFANQITSFILLKLKLGLTYEKIKAYELALGHYSGVIEEGAVFLAAASGNQMIIYRELLVLIMQAYLATLYLQEKLQEGITFQKIKYNIASFTKLIGAFTHDYENRDILLASYYSGIGTALFYKNMVLPQQINKLLVDAHFSPSITGKAQADSALLSCFYESFEKELIMTSKGELAVFDNPLLINSDARISFSIYLYYKKSLKILLGSAQDKLVDLLAACPEMIHAKSKETVAYRSLQHTRRLSSIAHGMAKMGDYLFPLMDNEAIPVDKALGCFYVDLSAATLAGTNDKPKNHINEARENLLYQYIGGKDITSDIKGKIHPRFIVHMYFLSALFYLESGDRSDAVFQLRKILFVLRLVRLTPKDEGTPISRTLQCLELNLIRRILELSSLMSHSSDRPQLARMKHYFDINTLRTPHGFSNELYSNLSNNPDTKETILAYALLKSRYHRYTQPGVGRSEIKNLWDCFNNIPEHKLLSPNNSISHQITRLMELELHSQINYKILTTYLAEKLKGFKIPLSSPSAEKDVTLFGKDSDWESQYYYNSKLYNYKTQKFEKRVSSDGTAANPVLTAREQDLETLFTALTKKATGSSWFEEYVGLVLNSIFNQIQMKRILNTFGANYILSYTHLAKVHEKLGTWVKHLHLCRIIGARLNIPIDLDTKLEALVGFQDSFTLDSLTEYQMALQYYYFAIQMHKEGKIYRNRMNNLIYLEDDFNDNLYHFGAGLERFQINSGSIRAAIDELKVNLGKANMYKYSTFIGDEFPVEGM